MRDEEGVGPVDIAGLTLRLGRSIGDVEAHAHVLVICTGSGLLADWVQRGGGDEYRLVESLGCCVF